MASTTQDWMYGFIMYFVGSFLFVSLFSIAGVFRENEIVTDTRFSSSLQGNVDQNVNVTSLIDPSVNLFSGFKWGNYFKDVFSFFFYNITIYDNTQGELMKNMWIIRIILVYLPLLAFLLCVYYSLPTVSG